MENLSIEWRKKVFIFVAIFCFLFNLWSCYRDARRSLEQGVHLNVSSRAGTGLSVYNQHILPNDGGYYTTGTQGDLYWRPRSLKEAAVLNTLSGHGIDLLNLAAVFVLSCVIIYTFKGSREGAVFTKNMNIGFPLVIALLVIMEVVCEVARQTIGHDYLPYITHNRFVGLSNFKSTPSNFILPLLMFLSNIPNKGLEQQKEAELTI